MLAVQDFSGEEEGYHKTLKPRQIQMIAIGGAIGTGLFLGAGGRLASAGPGLFLVYAICGVFVFLILRALGELVVEDIIDTGLTLSYLISNLLSRSPESLEIMTMFRKPEAQKNAVEVKYVGFDIPNEFVVGYGLDFDGRYRNLTSVGTLAPHVYS